MKIQFSIFGEKVRKEKTLESNVPWWKLARAEPGNTLESLKHIKKF